MKKIFYLLALFAGTVIVNAQTNIDSLVNLLTTQAMTANERINLYKEICVYYLGNDMEKCIEKANDGLALAITEKDRVKASFFNQSIGSSYATLGKSDTALSYYHKALDLAILSKSKDQEASVYCSLATFYALRSKGVMALEYYMKSLSLLEETTNGELRMFVLSSIGEIYHSLYNEDRAMYYLKQAKTMAEDLNSSYGKMNVYYSLGVIYLENKEYEKALKYISKVVEFSHIDDDKEFEILGTGALAYIYCEGFKDCKKAEEYANESLHIAEEYNDPRLILTAWSALSDIYREQQLYKDCEAAAIKAWEMDTTDLYQGISLTYNIALSNAFLENRNKALIFFQKYQDINKKYINKSFHETLTDMEVKYETEKKEMRITSLEKEKTLYIWLGVTGITILSLAFGMLFFRNRLNMQKRKVAEQQVRQLEQEKQLIAAQAVLEGEATERSRLARDLHDGLGGLLSVVKLNLKEVKSYATMDNTDVVHFGKAVEMVDESIVELRRVAHHIMPESLMRYGLRVSLEDFCRAIPMASFHYYGSDTRLDSRMEVLIYRCAYELMNNAVKHSDATIINMQLIVDGVVSLSVQDNGCGFDPAMVASGTGLENLRARVSVYNGKMNIYSSPEKGTEVNIEIEGIDMGLN